MGVSHCLNRTVSLSIEDNDIKIAKRKIVLGIFFVLAFTIIIIVNLISNEEMFLMFFHSDPNTVAAMRQTFFIFMAILLFEGVQILFLGILKTLQMDKLWKLPALSHYLIALGSAIIFGFWLDLKLEGIWLGWLLGILSSLAF